MKKLLILIIVISLCSTIVYADNNDSIAYSYLEETLESREQEINNLSEEIKAVRRTNEMYRDSFNNLYIRLYKVIDRYISQVNDIEFLEDRLKELCLEEGYNVSIEITKR